jgi:transposase
MKKSNKFSPEVKELRRATEILKLASAFFAQAELDRRLKS